MLGNLTLPGRPLGLISTHKAVLGVMWVFLTIRLQAAKCKDSKCVTDGTRNEPGSVNARHDTTMLKLISRVQKTGS